MRISSTHTQLMSSFRFLFMIPHLQKGKMWDDDHFFTLANCIKFKHSWSLTAIYWQKEVRIIFRFLPSVCVCLYR
ncbi:unnamed protein product [Larinioides sclopetarius]|uniref:Uncharacterized protein n=1 Tax=Larinioides sclopetarius TaxID=280406 RepID=A0AAV2ARK7_9ARAC